MATDKRDLLAVLKAELAYLERGGYRQTTRAVWRPHFVFQDSPACLNFDTAQAPRPCSDCVLMQLVPENAAKQKIPCRYIPLDERGKTIDWFYRCGTEEDLESAVQGWRTRTKLNSVEPSAFWETDSRRPGAFAEAVACKWRTRRDL